MVGTIILIAVIAAIVVIFIGGYNKLVAQRNKVKNAWAQIDVQLKRRHDLIPNLVEVVKDYMAYEQETLDKVIQARNLAMNAGSREEAIQSENILSGTLKSLFAVVENYPDLKSNSNATQLQEELTGTENKIAFSRQYYNDSVMAMNTLVEQFPSNMVAVVFGFGKEVHFEVPKSEKEPVKVNLR